MNKTIYNMCLLALGILFTSCEHKELCYEHPHSTEVQIIFDWSYAPYAEKQNLVEGMCLWFYPVDEDGNQTGKPLRFDLAGMKGGTIEIPNGRYQVLYYNNDYEIVEFRGTDEFWQQECYTREGHIFEPIYGNTVNYAPRANGTESERVVVTPDMMWGDHAMNVEIRPQGLSYWFVRDGETERTTIERDDHRFTLMPHEQICNYTYEIRNVKNLDGVTQMSASLSGMSGSVFCAAEQVRREYVTVPFNAAAGSSTTIDGQFYTFGHYDRNADINRDGKAGETEVPHKLVLYVWLNDGSKYYYTFDVTDQVDLAPDKRHVHIVVEDLDLPKPITGGDMEVAVDDWIVVNEDIEM